MRKVCVVITARPSYCRVQTVLEALQARRDVDLSVVVAASALCDRYGHVVDQIRADGFPVVAEAHGVIEGASTLTSALETGLLVTQLAPIFARLRPDCVVTVADRHETLATAIAASYQHLPLVHLQGGEVSGSIDDKVRFAISQLADWHFVATDKARMRLTYMLERRDYEYDLEARVLDTGCPSIDLALRARADPLPESLPGVGSDYDPAWRGLVVVQHPVTTEADAAEAQMTETLQAVRQIKLPRLVFWPGEDAGQEGSARAIRRFREQHPEVTLRAVKNLPPRVFLRVLYGAAVVVGNSSVALREGAVLGVPAVNVGTRQSGRERAENVVDAPYQRAAIRAAIEAQLAHGPYPASMLYGDGQAGARIAELLATVPLTARIEVAA